MQDSSLSRAAGRRVPENSGHRVPKEREQSTVSGLSCPQLPLWHLGGHKMGKTMALQSLACQDITGHRDEAAHKAWELPHPMKKPGDGCHEATAARKRANPTEISVQKSAYSTLHSSTLEITCKEPLIPGGEAWGKA